MNTLAHAAILIAVFVIAALIGQFTVNRYVRHDILEQHHSAGEAMMGVVGTLFSVLLGFMVAGAMEKYHDTQIRCEQEATNVASVFRIARGLSDVDRPRIRQFCRDYVEDVITSEWPKMEEGTKINHGWETYQKLWEAVVAVVPENDRQNDLQQGLVAAMTNLGENRRARILLAQATVPLAMWFIVGFGACLTVALSYVFASRFPRVQSFMTTLVATALALNIWLLGAYSQPFCGEFKIRPSMFQLMRESILVVPDTPSRYLHDSPSDKPSTEVASPKAVTESKATAR